MLRSLTDRLRRRVTAWRRSVSPNERHLHHAVDHADLAGRQRALAHQDFRDAQPWWSFEPRGR